MATPADINSAYEFFMPVIQRARTSLTKTFFLHLDAQYGRDGVVSFLERNPPVQISERGLNLNEKEQALLNACAGFVGRRHALQYGLLTLGAGMTVMGGVGVVGHSCGDKLSERQKEIAVNTAVVGYVAALGGATAATASMLHANHQEFFRKMFGDLEKHQIVNAYEAAFKKNKGKKMEGEHAR